MTCRFLTIDSDWFVRAAEDALITSYKPLWNASGLGSHVPGRGRPGTRVSQWDQEFPPKQSGLFFAEDNRAFIQLGPIPLALANQRTGRAEGSIAFNLTARDAQASRKEFLDVSVVDREHAAPRSRSYHLISSHSDCNRLRLKRKSGPLRLLHGAKWSGFRCHLVIPNRHMEGVVVLQDAKFH